MCKAGYMSEPENEFIETLYHLFNARDVDGVFEMLHIDVMWANGMEGGHAHGLDELRAYWTRQWELISTKVTPLDVQPTPEGLVVKVRQEVRSVDGELLSDNEVSHAFTVIEGKIARFDILES